MFYVTVARWMYAEIQLVSPEVLPALDRLLARLEVPTHDKWDTTPLKDILKETETSETFARTLRHLASQITTETDTTLSSSDRLKSKT
jgi:hypothetical protein